VAASQFDTQGYYGLIFYLRGTVLPVIQLK